MALTGLRKLLKQKPSGRGAANVTRQVSDADWQRVERWLVKGYSFKQIFGIVHAQVPQKTHGAFSQAFYVWEKKRKRKPRAQKPRKTVTVAVKPHTRIVKKPRKKKATQAQLEGLKKARAVRAANRKPNGRQMPLLEGAQA